MSIKCDLMNFCPCQASQGLVRLQHSFAHLISWRILLFAIQVGSGTRWPSILQVLRVITQTGTAHFPCMMMTQRRGANMPIVSTQCLPRLQLCPRGYRMSVYQRWRLLHHTSKWKPDRQSTRPQPFRSSLLKAQRARPAVPKTFLRAQLS